MSYEGMIAAVTGGGSGIGLATARAMVAAGARVAALDLQPPEGEAGVLAVVADVTDQSSLDKAAVAVLEALGPVDVLVCNAGIGATGTVEDNDDDEWHRVYDVNVVGIVRTVRAFLPHLRQSDRAAIVTTASVVSTVGLVQRAVYGASKGAVLSLTLAMAADLVGEGIRVNTVCPGTVDTPWVGRLLDQADDPAAARAGLVARQPVGRLGTAEEVAAAITYLASPAAGYVTGTALAIDGGIAGIRVPGGEHRLLIDLPRLGLGCAPIGNLYTEVSEDDARATVDAAWDVGVRFFDTAPLYGHGVSERRLGEAVAGRRRDDLVIATKVGRLLVPDDPDAAPVPTIFRGVPAVHPVFDYSEAGVLRSIEDSLGRLGLDRVDVVHVHDPDDHAADALAGAFPVLRRLRDEGVIGAVGAGMNQAPMLARFVREAGVDCVLLAGRYSLLDQTGLTELLPLCEREGVAVIAAGVFNSGLLADPRPGATYDYAAAPPALVARARHLDEACSRHGVPLRAAALQFPLAHPAVRTVLAGARSGAEMAENAALIDLPLPAALWDDLVSAGLLPDGVPVPR